MKFKLLFIALFSASTAQAKTINLYCTWDGVTSGFRVIADEKSKSVMHFYLSGMMQIVEGNFSETELSYTVKMPGMKDYYSQFAISRIDLKMNTFINGPDLKSPALLTGNCIVGPPQAKF